MTNVGVYIGRFQPLHKGHLNIITEGLINNDLFIVIIGSAGKHDSKNPFNAEIRERFIFNSIEEYDFNLLKKLTIAKLDAIEVKEIWYPAINTLIIDAINKYFNDKVITTMSLKYKIILYGCLKDDATSKCYNGVLNNTIANTSYLCNPLSCNNII